MNPKRYTISFHADMSAPLANPNPVVKMTLADAGEWVTWEDYSNARELRIHETRRGLADLWLMIEGCSTAADGSITLSPRACAALIAERRAHETFEQPEPFAWTKVIDGPYDMHPRDTFLAGPHAPRGDGWEPLYKLPRPTSDKAGEQS